MPITDLLKDYASQMRQQRRANPEVAEPGLAPAFQRLLEGLIAALPGAPGLVVAPEFLNPGIGRPDIALTSGFPDSVTRTTPSSERYTAMRPSWSKRRRSSAFICGSARG